jgi:hypothetical protein
MLEKKDKTTNTDTEEKKRFIMKVGVIAFSVIILALWIFSLSFSFAPKKNNTEDNDSSWQQDLKETINTVRDDFNINKDSNNEDPNTEEKAFLDDMLNNIEDKEQVKIPVVIPEETGVSTSTEPQKFLKELENKLPFEDISTINCPAYINCMPTIGQARPCVIPPGCEDITQIAY